MINIASRDINHGTHILYRLIHKLFRFLSVTEKVLVNVLACRRNTCIFRAFFRLNLLHCHRDPSPVIVGRNDAIKGFHGLSLHLFQKFTNKLVQRFFPPGIIPCVFFFNLPCLDFVFLFDLKRDIFAKRTVSRYNGDIAEVIDIGTPTVNPACIKCRSTFGKQSLQAAITYRINTAKAVINNFLRDFHF
nr:MAG TPA: hypothetical protein [Caudoviricetes sp.]